MKKILSFVLCVVLLAAVFLPTTVSAYESPVPPFEWSFVEDEAVIAEVKTSFKDLFLKKYPVYSSPDESFPDEEMYVQVICTQDEAVIYFGAFGASADVETSQLIGQYVFFNGALFGPEYKNPNGLYAMDNKGITHNLIDAYEVGWVDIDNVAAHYPWHTRLSDIEFSVIKKLSLDTPHAFGCYYHYIELSSYYADASADEATPNFVLIEAAGGAIYQGTYVEEAGDFIVASRTNFGGNKLCYYVYLPKCDELITLSEALQRDICGVEEAMLNSEIPTALKGDCDGDGKLTVKDATYIQKLIAGIEVKETHENLTLREAVHDFDKDSRLTVKDATAIQKKLAGLDSSQGDKDYDAALLGAKTYLRFILDEYCTYPFLAPGNSYHPSDIERAFSEIEKAESLLEKGDYTLEEITNQTESLIDALSPFLTVTTPSEPPCL